MCGSVTVTFMNMAAQVRTTSQLLVLVGHHWAAQRVLHIWNAVCRPHTGALGLIMLTTPAADVSHTPFPFYSIKKKTVNQQTFRKKTHLHSSVYRFIIINYTHSIQTMIRQCSQVCSLSLNKSVRNEQKWEIHWNTHFLSFLRDGLLYTGNRPRVL